MKQEHFLLLLLLVLGVNRTLFLNFKELRMKKVFVLAIIAAVFIFSCGKKSGGVKLTEGTPEYQLALDLSQKLPFLDPKENKVLVSTKNFDITSGEVVQVLKSNLGTRDQHLKAMDANRLKRIILDNAEKLAEKRVLLQTAQKANIAVSDAEFDSTLNLQYQQAGGEEKFLEFLKNSGIDIEYVKSEIKKGLTIQKYIDNKMEQESKITEKDIQTAYEGDKTATVRHILLKTQGKSDEEKQEIRKKMEDLLVRARNGEDFAKLAEEYTEDIGSKKNGGLYKDFARGMMVPAFEEAAFSVPVGEISDIVETTFGYHILNIIGRKKETKPLEEVREQIVEGLKRKRQAETYNNLIKRLKDEAELTVISF